MEQPIDQESIEPQAAEPDIAQEQDKLREAYICERTKLEFTEIELNRSKIILVDGQGNIKRIPLMSEH